MTLAEMPTRAFAPGVEGDYDVHLLLRRWLAAVRIESRTELCARFARVSPRERQVMALVTAGKLNKQIAADLCLSETTVKVHRGAVMRKMGARSLADLVRMADAIGVDPAPLRIDCSKPARSVAAADHHSGCIPAPAS